MLIYFDIFVKNFFIVEKTLPLHVGRGPVPRRGYRAWRDRGGQAPALRLSRPPPFTVGRGPVPRHAAVYRKIAGACPPRCLSSRGGVLGP